MASNEDQRRVMQGEDALPIHACLGPGRCPWDELPVTCALCRELLPTDDVSDFVDRLIGGN